MNFEQALRNLLENAQGNKNEQDKEGLKDSVFNFLTATIANESDVDKVKDLKTTESKLTQEYKK